MYTYIYSIIALHKNTIMGVRYHMLHASMKLMGI